MIHQYDVVIIGGEISGLYGALAAAQNACEILAKEAPDVWDSKATIRLALCVQRNQSYRSYP
jgi:succinate dehydrogenase/fumarate reductase flavoprotein subunit